MLLFFFSVKKKRSVTPCEIGWLLWQVTPPAFTLSLFLVLLNVPLFLFGLKKQGLCFTIYSIWAVFIYSGVSFLINEVLPVDVATASPFAGSDLLLCAIFGGLISGIGSGLTIRWGGAIDGIEVMAVIFAKRLGLTVTAEHILIPRKSVTAIIGLADHPLKKGARGCATCRMRETCMFRKGGTHC